MKRRPEPTVLAPERLRRFVPSEWTVPPLPTSGFVSDWMAEHWQHLGRFHAWRDARRVWSADHGDALGNFVERFHFEREVKSAHYSVIKEFS